MRVRFTPGAVRDLARICGYIARDSPNAATRVADEVERSAAMLADQPDAGRPTSRKRVRSLAVSRLPYLLFYRQSGGEIQVLTVRDGRRRPLT